MQRASWSEVGARPASFYLLVGRIQEDFAGGPREAFDTARLRLATALMKRSCTGLALHGTAAVHGVREGDKAIVLIAVEDPADFQRLNALTSSTPLPNEAWKGRSGFLLDEALHNRLLQVAGPGDQRGRGRRAKERAAAQEADRSLYWGR